jgi:RNA polymerase sigma factor (sigma-70 family)
MPSEAVASQGALFGIAWGLAQEMVTKSLTSDLATVRRMALPATRSVAPVDLGESAPWLDSGLDERAVAESATPWRTLAKMQQAYEGLGNEVGPAIEFALVVNTAISCRRLWRRYLWRRFRWSPKRPTVISPTRVRFPDEVDLLVSAVAQHQLYQQLFIDAVVASVDAKAAGHDDHEALVSGVSAIRKALSESPVLLVGMGIHSPVGEHREGATLGLAGWLDTRISLSANQRLQRWLERENPADQGSARERLRSELPAAAFAAMAEHGFREPTKALLNRAARFVERYLLGASKMDAFTQQLGEREVRDDDAAIEQWASREELKEMLLGAGLSERERDVLELMLDGQKEREIADQLGIAPGTVAATKNHAKRKLERYLGAGAS